MRRLFLLQGAQGCGKSTLVDDLGISKYTISTDLLRRLCDPSAGAVTDTDFVSWQNLSAMASKQAFDIAAKLCEARMVYGSTIVIDSIGANRRTMRPFIDLAHAYDYQIIWVNCQSNINLDTCLARNRTRSVPVPDDMVTRTYERIVNFQELPGEKRISREQFCATHNKTLTVEADAYESIEFIGDVHGHYGLLKDAGITDLDPTRLYVFVGDMLDRGPKGDRKKTFDFLFEAAQHDNCLFIKGNHEVHWHKLRPDKLPEIDLSGLPRQTKESFSCLDPDYIEKTSDLVKKRFEPVAVIHFRDKSYIVNHGGIHPGIVRAYGSYADIYDQTVLSLDAGMLSEDVFVYGSSRTPGQSDYNLDIDGIFDAACKSGKLPKSVIQVHGHRNGLGIPSWQYANSVNLESGHHPSNFHLLRMHVGPEGDPFFSDYH